MEVDEPIIKGNESILFVDDENEIVRLNEVLLTSLGYRPTLANKARTALDMFAKDPNRFDIVITDQMMPEMNGLDLAIELQKIRPNVPIILCTGYTAGISDDEAREMGICEILHKPIGRTQMAQAIRRAMGESQMVPSLPQVEDILKNFS